MKNKTNFTYKQFIEKISNVTTFKEPNLQKSPKVLKITNNNFIFNDEKDQSKFFLRNNSPKQATIISSFILTMNYSPNKNKNRQDLENKIPIFNTQNLNLNTKNTQRNNKLKISNINNLPVNNKQRHNKSVKQIIHKKSEDIRHLQSCSNFFNLQQNISDNKKVSVNHVNSKNKNKKNPGKIQKNLRQQQGSLTERNSERLNTQNQNFHNNERVNTQYDRERISTQYDRDYSPFYQKSINEPNFIDFQDTDPVQKLFEDTTQKKSISLQKKVKKSKKIKLNEKSNQYVYNKFIQEINNVLASIIKIKNQTLLLEHKIKYIEYLECLKELKMIKNDYEPYSQTSAVDFVREFWEELIVGHNVNHFIVILSIVLKVSPLSSLEQGNSKDFHNYVYLQKKYEYFRLKKLQLSRARLNFDNQSNITNYNNLKQEPNYRELTPKSKGQKKYKINAQLQNEINFDFKMGISNGNLSFNTEYDQQILRNQSITSPSLRKTFRSPLGIKRSQILYDQGRKKSLQKKFDKTTIDYEFERNAKQLTFKPKLTVKRKNQYKFSLEQNVSSRILADEQKSINRMIRGRIQKQIKNITIGKGHPYNQKTIEKMKKQKYEQVLKQMQTSKIKQTQQIAISQNRQINFNQQETKKNEKCNGQEFLSKMLDLSFHCITQNQKVSDEHPILSSQKFMQKDLKNELFSTQFSSMSGRKQNNLDQVQSKNLFILDIYIGENQCQKLQIGRNSSLEEVNAEAEEFVKKHNLSSEMQQKLKHELIIAMKFHNLEKIDENAEEDECSLLM